MYVIFRVVYIKLIWIKKNILYVRYDFHFVIIFLQVWGGGMRQSFRFPHSTQESYEDT